MSDRKKPGVAFWAIVVVVVVLAYPLSMGPVWWLFHQVRIPVPIRDGVDTFYNPVWEARWMRSYLDWWTVDQPPVPGPI